MGRAAGAAVEEERAGTNTTCTIKTHHFDVAFSKVSPSVSDKVCLILLVFFTHEIWYIMVKTLVLDIYVGIHFIFWSSKCGTIGDWQRGSNSMSMCSMAMTWYMFFSKKLEIFNVNLLLSKVKYHTVWLNWHFDSIGI